MKTVKMHITGGGVGLLGLVGLAVLLSGSGSGAIYVVLAFFLSLLILNFPIALRSTGGVTIERVLPSHVCEGDDVQVRLIVTNRSGGPRLLLSLVDAFCDGGPIRVPVLAGGESSGVLYSFQPKKRGVYEVADCRIESCSPFGLVHASRSVSVDSPFVVYPKFYELPNASVRLTKSFTGYTGAPGSRAGEGAAFFGLRRYHEGDPIRKVHWESTLRSGKMMVKEFEEDQHSAVALVMDTCRHSVVTRGEDSNLETAIRAAATLANYGLRNEHPVTLHFMDERTGELRNDHSTGDLTPLLDALARADATDLSAGELMSRILVDRHGDVNWFVILLSLQDKPVEEILRMRAGGADVFVVLCSGTNQPLSKREESLSKQLEDCDIPLIYIPTGKPVDEALAVGLLPVKQVVYG